MKGLCSSASHLWWWPTCVWGEVWAAQACRERWFPWTVKTVQLQQTVVLDILRVWHQWCLRDRDILEAQRCIPHTSFPSLVSTSFSFVTGHAAFLPQSGWLPSGPPPSFSQTFECPPLSRAGWTHLHTLCWDSLLHCSPPAVPPQELTTHHSSICVKKCRYTIFLLSYWLGLEETETNKSCFPNVP